jgi:hypothetical protein
MSANHQIKRHVVALQEGVTYATTLQLCNDTCNDMAAVQ